MIILQLRWRNLAEHCILYSFLVIILLFGTQAQYSVLLIVAVGSGIQNITAGSGIQNIAVGSGIQNIKFLNIGTVNCS